MIIKQDDKEFFSMEIAGRIVYFVYSINCKPTTGRQGSYEYVKCNVCGKIVGTQFKAHLKHFKTHETKAD